MWNGNFLIDGPSCQCSYCQIHAWTPFSVVDIWQKFLAHTSTSFIHQYTWQQRSFAPKKGTRRYDYFSPQTTHQEVVFAQHVCLGRKAELYSELQAQKFVGGSRLNCYDKTRRGYCVIDGTRRASRWNDLFETSLTIINWFEPFALQRTGEISKKAIQGHFLRWHPSMHPWVVHYSLKTLNSLCLESFRWLLVWRNVQLLSNGSRPGKEFDNCLISFKRVRGLLAWHPEVVKQVGKICIRIKYYFYHFHTIFIYLVTQEIQLK